MYYRVSRNLASVSGSNKDIEVIFYYLFNSTRTNNILLI